MKKLKEVPEHGPKNVTNALFVGSTAELQKMLKAKNDCTGLSRKSKSKKGKRPTGVDERRAARISEVYERPSVFYSDVCSYRFS